MSSSLMVSVGADRKLLVWNELRKFSLEKNFICIVYLTRYWPNIGMYELQPVYFCIWSVYLANKYIFKVNNRNSRETCEICSNVTVNIPEQI